jgi:hypothetical protein
MPGAAAMAGTPAKDACTPNLIQKQCRMTQSSMMYLCISACA